MAEKLDGKLIVDEYELINHHLKRLDAILAASQEVVGDDEIWRRILEDEAYQAYSGIEEILEDIKKKFSVIEYIQTLKEKYVEERGAA